MSTPNKEFFRYRYLMGAMQQNLLTATVRQLCIPEDIANLGKITEAWRVASARMAALSQEEAGLQDGISKANPPSSIQSKLAGIEQDHLFRESFSAMPTTFKVVEIDKLVAPQREVNLDYVDSIRKRISGKKIEDLVELCVGARTEPPELKALQTAQNQMTFSSRSLDLRFLGGAPKPITEADIAVTPGGQPVETIALLVGFGAAPMNTFMFGNRIVLNNGFHRVIALRMEGVTHIPIVVQNVANAELEFPEQILGLSLVYLLQNPRPVLVKDFFDDKLTVELRLKPRRKIVKVGWGVEESLIPD